MKKILIINVLFAIALCSCSTEDVKPLKILKKKQELFEDPKAPPPPPPPLTN